MHQLSPVLIANRGEIALRVARTVHALGLASAGVFTAADAGSPHVDGVDAAARIGSYLSIEDVLAAARALGARSVHPGYGFLSENAAFARAVEAAGLIWIGPPASAIELMGDKGRAKEAAAAAGVPVVPDGSAGGFPVVVKAVAGGGGKGMRVVRRAEELEEARAAAAREAAAAFGDDRVLVERYLERPRHLEVQVLADAHGTVIHLGERECSLQRRHQKVVEEAPSPVVSPALRAELGAAAVALTAACGYRGAGTVELIATGDASEWFFLEMNTRLQVEHPVTEFVWGVDLVELQLRVAAGERLPEGLGTGAPNGHAVEARLYAEDPDAGFLPATGTIRRFRAPTSARFDGALREGLEIGTGFDPMLAKVIAHGPDRATALGRVGRALGELELLGVTTNGAFTRALLAREDVRAGQQDTGLLERLLDGDPLAPPPADLLPAAALAVAGTATPPGPWRRVLSDGTVLRLAGGRVHVAPAGARPGADAVPAERAAPADGAERSWSAAGPVALPGGRLRIELDGVARSYVVARDGDEAIWIGRDGFVLEARTRRADRSGAALPAGSLEAPMPGTVLQVRVSDGDAVAEGDVLLVLESMKMELSIIAPYAGTVAGLTLAEGDKVTLKQPLVAIVEEDA